MAEIIVRHRGRDVGRVAVEDREITVGRQEGNDVVIPHPKVSRLHARIVPRADGVHLEDCGSKRGCFIDGERVLDRVLRDGDEIWVEEHVLVYRLDPKSPAAESGPMLRFQEPIGGEPDWKLLRTAIGGPQGGADVEQRLSALVQIGQIVDEQRDFEAVLREVMDLAVTTMGAERGFLMLAKTESDELQVHVARGGGADIVGLERDQISRSLLRRVTRTRKPVLVQDAMDHDWGTESIMAHSIHSALCAPLLSGDRLTGALYVDHRSRAHAFGPLDLAFFAIFARQARTVIEGSRSYWEIQRRLAEKDRLASLGALAAAVAHEIKNPLNFVLNFAELSHDLGDAIRDELGGLGGDRAAALIQIADDVAGNAAKIREHARRIDVIVDTMRLYAPRRAERRPVEVARLLPGQAARAHQAARAREPALAVDVRVEAAEDTGAVTCVREDLEQVVYSLVKNACQAAWARARAAGGAPVVQVRAQSLGDRVEIRVHDNGAGIPAAIGGRIFDPFSATRPAGEGLGLELSICYDIVTLRQQGEIRFETADGQFTEFIVTLPRAPIGDATGVGGEEA